MAVDGERVVAAARNSAGEKGEQKDECKSSGHMVRRSRERRPLVLLSKAFGWESENSVRFCLFWFERVS